MKTALLFLLFVCPLVERAEPPVQPVTVCEVMQNLADYDGKVVAVVGRYSFRAIGRWLGEQKCGQKLVIGGEEWPNALWLAFDPNSALQPPAVLEVDAVSLAKKLRTVKQGTSLTKIRFGSSDYDNWAVVYDAG